MNAIKHLTENQLLGYAAGLLEKAESNAVGGHLLNCSACRDSLPAPTPEQFFAVLMGGREVKEDYAAEKRFSSILPFFTSFSAIFQKTPGLGWSSGALIVILGFSFLIWFANGYQTNEEREVAQVFDVEKGSLKQNEVIEQILPPPAQNPETETQDTSSASNRAAADSKLIVSRSNQQKKDQDLPENKLRVIPAKKVLNEKKENIVLTRGGSVNCSNEDLIEMEFVSNEEAITFRWKKAPNALKYNLYISDDNEILIDEFETNQDTSYVLKKPLNPKKTYKWKVVITLEDGQTASGASQKFTVKDLLQNQKNLPGKKKSDIRCSGNK